MRLSLALRLSAPSRSKVRSPPRRVRGERFADATSNHAEATYGEHPHAATLARMASIVASAFRDRILSALSSDGAALLDNARGSGPEYREMNRALLLADRAVREWAASAISDQR